MLIIVSAGQAATRCHAAYYRYSENGTRQYVQAMIGRRRRAPVRGERPWCSSGAR